MKAPRVALLSLLGACTPPPSAPPPAVEIQAPDGSASLAAPRASDPRIRQISVGVYEVEATLFEALISDPARVAPRAWAEPTERGEELAGYRLGGIAPGSLLAQLGLMDDDVIEIVNGERARTEAAIRAARASAQRTAQVTVVLCRNGFQKLMIYRLIYRGNRSIEP